MNPMRTTLTILIAALVLTGCNGAGSGTKALNPDSDLTTAT